MVSIVAITGIVCALHFQSLFLLHCWPLLQLHNRVYLFLFLSCTGHTVYMPSSYSKCQHNENGGKLTFHLDSYIVKCYVLKLRGLVVRCLWFDPWRLLALHLISSIFCLTTSMADHNSCTLIMVWLPHTLSFPRPLPSAVWWPSVCSKLRAVLHPAVSAQWARWSVPEAGAARGVHNIVPGVGSIYWGEYDSSVGNDMGWW